MDSETNQKSSYRKIKQRQNFSNSPNQQQQQHHHNHHHPQQQSQRIRIHQENHRSRSWYQKTNSENQHSKENEIPAVKILAKSNKLPVPSSSTSSSSNDTNSQHQDTDTNSTSTVNSKPRPSPSFLEKNIQPLLKVHSSQNNVQSEATTAVNKQPKYVKIVDFEFNFTVQPDTSSWSIVDSWLLPDSNSSNHQTSNSTSTNCTAASGPSSSNIKQGFSGQSFSIVAAVGLDGVGKSSLLNSLAQCDVFETRKIMSIKNRENPLNHVTNGIDMHITCERVFLLDTQVMIIFF